MRKFVWKSRNVPKIILFNDVPAYSRRNLTENSGIQVLVEHVFTTERKHINLRHFQQIFQNENANCRFFLLGPNGSISFKITVPVRLSRSLPSLFRQPRVLLATTYLPCRSSLVIAVRACAAAAVHAFSFWRSVSAAVARSLIAGLSLCHWRPPLRWDFAASRTCFRFRCTYGKIKMSVCGSFYIVECIFCVRQN